jgi:hypothetical protein
MRFVFREVGLKLLYITEVSFACQGVGNGGVNVASVE